jgi:adenylate cyclase
MVEKPLPRDVKKALALFRANPGRDHRLGELAAACGVAPRTLQKHFRRFLGITPVAALRDLRLDVARRALLGGDEAARVTTLALRCGFNHLGRFSGWYRTRYGESPSTTSARIQRGLDSAVAATVLPLALDRPVVAVLPLDGLVADRGEAAGVAEEIALALHRLRWMALGSPRAARYHLRGHVRHDVTGDLRITVALLEAQTGRYLWADAWSGGRAAVPMFEERVARGIASKLQAVLRNVEIERACRREPDARSAWTLTMRALARAVRLEPAAQSEALEFAQQAIELAPQDPLPIAIAAWCHGMRAAHRFTSRPGAEQDAARTLAARAAALRARDATAEALLASAYTLAHDLDRAAAHVDRALALDGGCAWAWQRNGWVNVYRGAADEAMECFRIAQRLDPDDPLGFLSTIGLAAASFERGAYGDAGRWFKQGMIESPAVAWAHRYLAPSYALAGDKDAGRASLAALRAVYPEWTITQVRAALPHTPGFLDRASTGLESLGMRL